MIREVKVKLFLVLREKGLDVMYFCIGLLGLFSIYSIRYEMPIFWIILDSFAWIGIGFAPMIYRLLKR